jgi:hypothetical protein
MLGSRAGHMKKARVLAEPRIRSMVHTIPVLCIIEASFGSIHPYQISQSAYET